MAINTEFRLNGKDNTKAAFASMRRNMDGVRQGFASIQRAIMLVGAGSTLNRLVVQTQKSADAMRMLDARMMRFSGNVDGFARTVSLAQKLGVSLDDAGAGMTRLLIATQNLGTPLATIEKMQQNLVLLGRAGGSAPEEMANSIRQLGQGLAAGALRGDELRSVMEGMPLVAREIAKELGVDIGKLRDMGAQGAITSQVVIRALEDIGDLGASVPELFEQATQRMRNEWELTLAAMGRAFDASGLPDKFANFARVFRQDVMDDFRDVTTEQLQRDVESLTKAMEEPLKAFTERTKANGYGMSPWEMWRADLKQYEFDQDALLGYMGTDSIQAMISGQKEALVAINAELERRAKLEQRIAGTTKDVMELIRVDAKRLTAPSTMVGPTRAYGDNSGTSSTNVPGAPLELINIQAIHDQLIVAETELTDFDIFAEQAARNIQSSFAEFLFDPLENGFDGMVKGFANALRQMAAQAAASWILNNMFGGTAFGAFLGIGGKASGGSVNGGTPYIVGEKGPELFVPGKSGTIVPNNKLNGGGVTVVQHNTIDARGATQDVIRLLPGILAQNRAAAVADVRDLVRRGGL